MSAYGAVVSLLLTLDTILDDHPGEHLPISLDRRQLELLREKVSFLLKFFLENPLTKTKPDQNAADIFEAKIRDAAFKAENLIESHIYNLLSKPEPKPNHYYKDLLWSALFFAIYYIILLVLVRQLCHSIISVIVPADFRQLLSLSFDCIIFIFGRTIGETFIFGRGYWVTCMTLYWEELIDGIFKLLSATVQYVRQYFEWDARVLRQVLKEVGSVTDEVVKMKNEYGSEDLGPSRHLLPAASPSRGDAGVSGETVVVGFENDLAEIKTRLGSNSHNVEILPIVGMGGIGKTTLVRQVYNDGYIKDRFDIRAWVTMSQEYSLHQVLRGLLGSAGVLVENMSEMDEKELSLYLHQSLKGRRYLIVIDDIWDTAIWDAVRRFFPKDNNGSRVLLTTRLSKVALYSNSGGAFHQMRFLDTDESWDLLRNKILGERRCSNELEKLGREIAQNCGGLPLAIAVTGGLLSKVSRTEECWRSVADNLNSAFTNDDEQCMDILRLSYGNLPHCLKPCFLYMGVFPEDYEIPVSKLIRLWAAEGFLRPDRYRCLEELGEEYLEDLIERNLILVSERGANGKIKTCNIHDVLWNFCIKKAHSGSFLSVVKCYEGVFQEGKKKKTTPCRRLAIHGRNSLQSLPKLSKHTFFKKIQLLLRDIEIRFSSCRSLLCNGVALISSSDLYLGYRLLRVLDLVAVYFLNFPTEIIKVVNLRYLALSCPKALPPSISKFCNLQTIVYHNFRYINNCLPLEIWMMPKLRHICVFPSFFPDPLDPRILRNNSFLLENLLVLLKVRNFRCSDSIVERIPNLKKLGIIYRVSPFAASSEYQLGNLVNLKHLETLKLVVETDIPTEGFVNPPANLAFPKKLKSLTLSGCEIPWGSLTIIGTLPNLEVLKLKSYACTGSEWEPVEEEFCQLKHLQLERLDLVHWRADETHFPLLQRLIIRFCYQLNEIPSGIGNIPTLEMIELFDCDPPAVSSGKQIEEDQQDMGNMDLKVHVLSRGPTKFKPYSFEPR